MGDRRKKSDPDELLKAYYQIMRSLGPDPVLEERIEREEHKLNEERVLAGRKGG